MSQIPRVYSKYEGDRYHQSCLSPETFAKSVQYLCKISGRDMMTCMSEAISSVMNQWHVSRPVIQCLCTDLVKLLSELFFQQLECLQDEH